MLLVLPNPVVFLVVVVKLEVSVMVGSADGIKSS